MSKRGILIAVAAAGVAAPALADVINGSMESTALGGPSRAEITSLTDWSHSGGFMQLERAINEVSNIAAHTGDQFVSMGHNGAFNDTLFQKIETIPGELLVVSFAVHCIQGDAPQTVLAQAIDTGGAGLLGSVAGAAENRDQGWITYEFEFEAASEFTEIRFTHTIGSTFANIALDSVSVTPAPGMLGLALVGAGLWPRRRR